MDDIAILKEVRGKRVTSISYQYDDGDLVCLLIGLISDDTGEMCKRVFRFHAIDDGSFRSLAYCGISISDGDEEECIEDCEEWSDEMVRANEAVGKMISEVWVKTNLLGQEICGVIMMFLGLGVRRALRINTVCESVSDEEYIQDVQLMNRQLRLTIHCREIRKMYDGYERIA